MNPNQVEYNRRQREAAEGRAQRAIRLREAGETWETIGKLLGVSRQRAQALAKAHTSTPINGATDQAAA